MIKRIGLALVAALMTVPLVEAVPAHAHGLADGPQACRGVVLSPVGAGAPVTFSHDRHRATFAGGRWLDSRLTFRLADAPRSFTLGARFATTSQRGGVVLFRGYSLSIADGRIMGSGPVAGALTGPYVADGQQHHARIVSNGTRVMLRLDGRVVASASFVPVSGGSAFWVGYPTSRDFVGSISHVTYGVERHHVRLSRPHCA